MLFLYKWATLLPTAEVLYTLLHYASTFRNCSYQICSSVVNPVKGKNKLHVEDLALMIPGTKIMKVHYLTHIRIYVSKVSIYGQNLLDVI